MNHRRSMAILMPLILVALLLAACGDSRPAVPTKPPVKVWATATAEYLKRAEATETQLLPCTWDEYDASVLLPYDIFAVEPYPGYGEKLAAWFASFGYSANVIPLEELTASTWIEPRLLVVLDAHDLAHELTADQRTVIETFVREGGRLLLTAGYGDDEGLGYRVAQTLTSGQSCDFAQSSEFLDRIGLLDGVSTFGYCLNAENIPSMTVNDSYQLLVERAAGKGGKAIIAERSLGDGKILIIDWSTVRLLDDAWGETKNDHDNPTFWQNFNRLILTPYVKGCAVESSSSVADRPPQVRAEHIEQVRTIHRQAQEGEIDRATAEARLAEIAEEVGEDAFLWIVRRVPVYDEEEGRFVTLDTYMRDMAAEMGVPEGSRLAEDPLGTSMDLMFDEPSPDEMMDMLGLGW